MIKAKQRIEKLEKKTGGTKRSIISIARMKRVVRIFDGETHEDMPEHKECIGMDIDNLRKSLEAYYKDEETQAYHVDENFMPKVTVINSAVPRPGDRTPAELEVVNVERIITDDIKDIIPGARQAESLEEPSLEAEELSEEEVEKELKKNLAGATEEERNKLYEKAERVREAIKDMTDEELDQEIEEIKKKIEKEEEDKAKKA